MQGSTHAANQRNMQPPYPLPPPPSGWQPASGSWMSGPIHHINTISTSQSFQVRDIENRMQLDPHRIAMERPQETLTSNLYFKILIINTVRYSGRLIHRSFESSTAGGGRGGCPSPRHRPSHRPTPGNNNRTKSMEKLPNSHDWPNIKDDINLTHLLLLLFLLPLTVSTGVIIINYCCDYRCL